MLVTFAFTRHPFERLVSAYHHPANQWSHGYTEPMEFAKIVIKVILETLNGTGPPLLESRYIPHPLHYIPQYLACPYCQLEFDLVGRLEDMESDTAFLAQHLGLKVKSVINAYI